jgi:hypothetical protein
VAKLAGLLSTYFIWLNIYWWFNWHFKVIKFSLLEVVKQYLLLLSVTHWPKLSKFIHLKYRKCFLVILLLFLHIFQLLKWVHVLDLFLLHMRH